MVLAEENDVKTVNDTIANGGNNTPMPLPSATNSNSIVASISAPNSALNNILAAGGDDEDEESDTNEFIYNSDNDIFENFAGAKKTRVKKAKKPTADITRIQTSRERSASNTPVFIKGDDGVMYQSLGKFDGNLSFLDEVYTNVAPPPPGSFLYRVPTGLHFDGDGVHEYEYFVGSDPETSDLLGINLKGIGKAFRKGLTTAKTFIKKNLPAIKSGLRNYIASRAKMKIAANDDDEDSFFVNFNGDTYEYLGQWDGNLSFLDEIEPGMVNQPKGSFLYRVNIGNHFTGEPQYEYYVGDDPETSNGIGKFFKKIGKGIGKAVKAVGKGIKNATKFTAKTVGKGLKFAAKVGLSAIGADPGLIGGKTSTAVSNGTMSMDDYIRSQQGGGSFGTGGFSPNDYGNDDAGDETGNGENDQSGNNNNNGKTPPDEEPKKPNYLLYIIIALVFTGVAVYIIKHKK